MKNYLILLDNENNYTQFGTYKIITEHSIKDALYRLYCEVIGLPEAVFQKAYESLDSDVLRIEFMNLFLNDAIKDIVEYTPTDIGLSLIEKKSVKFNRG